MTAPEITQADKDILARAGESWAKLDSEAPGGAWVTRQDAWLSLATQRQSYAARIEELEARCEAVRLKSLEFASDATRHRNQRDAAEIAAQHSQTRALAAEAKLAEAREVIAPFALAIKPSVPGNQLMTQFAWDADEIRRAARFMEGNGDG